MDISPSIHWLWGLVTTLAAFIYNTGRKDTERKFASLEKRMNTVGGTLVVHGQKLVRHEEGQKHLTQAVEELKTSMEKNTDKLTDIHNLLCKVTGSLNQKE